MLTRIGRLVTSGGTISRSGALRRLNGETQGVAIDFTDFTMVVKDTVTPANAFEGNPNSKLTNTTPSTKYILNASGAHVGDTTLRRSYSAAGAVLGLLTEMARTNLFLNSRSPATQSITTSATSYTISGVGAIGATLTLSGAATGTLTGTGAIDRDRLTFTATAGTLTVTVSGTWDFVQVEAGTFATSPIVTTGTAVTRAADKITLASGAFYAPATGGTLVVVARRIQDTAAFPALVSIAGADANNSAQIGRYSTQRVGASVRVGGVIQADGASGAIITSGAPTIKAAYGYAPNDFALYVNGSQIYTDAAGSLPTAGTLGISRVNGDAGSQESVYIQEIMHLPRRMSNAELQAQTT